MTHVFEYTAGCRNSYTAAYRYEYARRGARRPAARMHRLQRSASSLALRILACAAAALLDAEDGPPFVLCAPWNRRRLGQTGATDRQPSMGKGQRKRQRKRLAKLGDEARRVAKRQRQEQLEQGGGAVVAEQQRPAEQAALIRAFHTLEKKLAAVATDPSLRDEEAREARRSALRAEQEALGGLDAYLLR